MAERAQWSSKLGFVLAASGSAIGLGNIVFFSANAYRYGAGAFYLPYLLALLLVGLPVLILELGLGSWSGKAFPGAMRQVGGAFGEWVGWFGLVSATFIAMYYVTILGWVLGMWVGAWGEALWAESVALPRFGEGGIAVGVLPNPVAFFFDLISSWRNALFVLLVWIANGVIVWRGAASIEKAVQVFVPLMWVCMLLLIVRGLTLDGGPHGAAFLFTPDFRAMADPEVWHGAFSQTFFTLSLGFGIMTAYASYLPKESDQTTSALMIASMNGAFEYLAGVAIFSMLFAFAMVPKASTISMMFFVVPKGIASFPTQVQTFGVLFFTLLLVAGLSSSVSLVESLASALIDKLGGSFGVRRAVVVAVTAFGFLGSLAFAWPAVVDPGLEGNGTLGLTLVDLIDHWAFGYGLLITGLLECLVVGWMFGTAPIVEYLDAHGKIRVGPAFDILIRFVVPAILITLLGVGIWREIRDGLYGATTPGAGPGLAWGSLAAWGLTSTGLAAVFTALPAREES